MKQFTLVGNFNERWCWAPAIGLAHGIYGVDGSFGVQLSFVESSSSVRLQIVMIKKKFTDHLHTDHIFLRNSVQRSHGEGFVCKSCRIEHSGS